MNSYRNFKLRTFPHPVSGGPSRRDYVKQVFENVPHYLAGRRVDIRFRRDTLRAFAETFSWRTLLDVGCGDGSISLPLLRAENRITWMDLSSSMLATGRAQVPESLAGNIRLRNEDFMAASFGSERFDLIVSVGVMAHVDSPDLFLSKLRSLLPPGGHLVLEFTDSRHIVGKIGRFWGTLKECFAPARYQTNKVSFSTLNPLFQGNGFRLVSSFRYSRLPLPGVDRLLDERRHYKLSSAVFGKAFGNTHASWGNEYICLLAAV